MPRHRKSIRRPGTAGIGKSRERSRRNLGLVSRKGSGAFLFLGEEEFTTELAEVHMVRGGVEAVAKSCSRAKVEVLRASSSDALRMTPCRGRTKIGQF